MEKRETIAALITAQGRSAVNVIRLSGADAFNMAGKIGAGENLEHHRLYVRNLSYKGRELDRGVIAVFKSPNSYTGEDVVEISVHGGGVSSKKIMSALIECGCRPAERGEFTKRAFKNNKMSLLEAEAVLFKVNSKTELEYDSASKSGLKRFEKIVKDIKERVIDLKAYIESSIDFPDDVDYSGSRARAMLEEISKIIDSFHKKSLNGYVGENHPLILIAGRSNTGKSTLFNALLRMERAIVSETPGTTRDIISEWVQINGHAVKLADTAGIRETKDDAEIKGIGIMKEKVREASLVLYLYDTEMGFMEKDIEEMRMLNGNVIVAGNKCDRKRDEGKRFLNISAKTGENLQALESMIIEALNLSEKSEISVNDRQMNIIERMKNKAESINLKKEYEQAEILNEHMKSLIDDIRELTGEITNEDVLDKIFKTFCIGK